MKKRIYNIDVTHCYTDFDRHYDRRTDYGSFSEDGASYTVTDRDTPRQWLNMLYNDRFASVVSNRGEGYTVYGGFYNRITRYYNSELYIVRDMDGRRVLELQDLETGESIDLLDNSHVRCTVRPGCSAFAGESRGLAWTVTLFVPTDAPCECWLISVQNTGKKARQLRLAAEQAWAFHNHFIRGGKKAPADRIETEEDALGYVAHADGLNKPYDTLWGGFFIEGYTAGLLRRKTEKTMASKKKDPAVYKDFNFVYADLYASFTLGGGESLTRTVVSSASHDPEEIQACKAFVSSATAADALCAALAKREADFSHNTCTLPDKNLERFLNTWLKYQLGLTYRYNRNSQTGGFRDVLQDSWGAMLIYPEYGKARLLEALSHLYSDGHSMRGYDAVGGLTDNDNFVDCPLWAPCTLTQYIKETGDTAVLDTLLPYFDSEEKETVETHLWKLLEHAWNKRGENGLLLMRDGDWLDGLSGVNQNGTATSAWATMQAFWAQNFMIELYEFLGNTEKANILKTRNEAYRTAVRTVAWDGKWYLYGFKSDGLPIGSSRCMEGKIYLNPQAWALLSGIETDPARIRAIRRSVDIYLTTPFGPCLLYPPYVNDTTCGRLWGQIPGTFANGAIYLHGGTFKVFGDYAVGDYDTAYDTMMRLMPGHIDNPDSRRTSEPWCTGNVHFGPDSPRFGMNLFSWFTATPAWLIHAGFGRMLGTEAGYEGLSVEPRVPSDWDAYSVTRLYRGVSYTFSCRRARKGEEKGIYDGDRFLCKRTLPVGTPAGTYTVLY